nr:helix-turn-helix domain-containing protein [Prescottella equi]
MRENGMAQTEIAEILAVGRTTLCHYLGPKSGRSADQ